MVDWFSGLHSPCISRICGEVSRTLGDVRIDRLARGARQGRHLETNMPTKGTPSFHELDRGDCIAILDRNHTGRIAFAFHDRVDIAPISYVYDDGWLYLRTEVGDKLVTMAHNRWVAFEVDEVEGPFAWRSVVVRGAVYLLDPKDGDVRAHRHGVELLRTLIPESLRKDDPVPFRNIVLRIHVDEVSGRAATSGR